MKNIFIRGGMSPFESFSAPTILLKNSIGTNVGNFLYLHGVLRNIVHEDTVITPTYYKWNYTDTELSEIEKESDCFIIPLADAFREDFRMELNGYTRMVKKMNIPCVVTGVGVRAPLDDKFDHVYTFDEDVKAFVQAVLNKSAKIGVRGERTGAYLQHLGFREEIDYTVIGCPSLYLNGPKLRIREPHINRESFVCYNTTDTTPDNLFKFVERSIKEFAKAQFVPQTLKELKLLYLGVPFDAKDKPLYPTRITDAAYCNKDIRFFLNVPTWIEYMKKADFNFGTRLHGNVAAVLAGTPSILFPKDSRVLELAEYHNMTRYPADKVTEETNIWNLIESADFKSVEKDHYAKYTHFIDFLEENGLEPYRQEFEPGEELPFEKRIKEVELADPVASIAGCSFEEAAWRMESYYPEYEKRITRLKARERIARRQKIEIEELCDEKKILIKENNELKSKVKTLNKENESLHEELRHSISINRIRKGIKWRTARMKNKT